MDERTFKVNPLKPRCLELSCGKKYELIYPVEVLLDIANEYGDITDLVNSTDKKQYEIATELLYKGLAILQPDITREECMSIVLSGGVPLMTFIYDAVLETYGVLDTDLDLEEIKKKVGKEVFQQISQMAQTQE